MSETKFIFFRQEPYHNTFFGVYDANQIQHIKRMFTSKAERMRQNEINWANNNLLCSEYDLDVHDIVDTPVDMSTLSLEKKANYEEYLKREANMFDYISRWENMSIEDLIDRYFKDNNYSIIEIPYNNADELYFNNSN